MNPAQAAAEAAAAKEAKVNAEAAAEAASVLMELEPADGVDLEIQVTQNQAEAAVADPAETTAVMAATTAMVVTVVTMAAVMEDRSAVKPAEHQVMEQLE